VIMDIGDQGPLPLAASADGWRGLVGESFNETTASLLADSALEVLCPQFGRRILIAYDGRVASKDAAEAILHVARNHGAEQLVLAPHLPTPIAAAMLFNNQVDVAIIVTASHNPASWNGVKFKAGQCGSVSGQLEKQIDMGFKRSVARGEKFDNAVAVPHIELSSDRLAKDHCDHLRSKLGNILWAGQRIVIDGLGGVAGTPIADLCRSLGAEVMLIGGVPTEHFDGYQPDPTLIASQERCQHELKKHDGQLGIVLDGDGDRIVLIGRDGQVWQGQEVLAALLSTLPQDVCERLSGPLIVTSSTGALIRQMADKLGRQVVETPIGFKHIVEHLNRMPNSIAVGAVGDYGFQHFGSDRDPFALLILLAKAFPKLQELGNTICNLRKQYKTENLQWFEKRWELSPDASLLVAERVLGETVRNAGGVSTPCKDGRRYEFPNSQWVLTRPSTTEGGIRLYGELEEPEQGYTLLADAQLGLEYHRVPSTIDKTHLPKEAI